MESSRNPLGGLKGSRHTKPQRVIGNITNPPWKENFPITEIQEGKSAAMGFFDPLISPSESVLEESSISHPNSRYQLRSRKGEKYTGEEGI
jgi:hypothetical protein